MSRSRAAGRERNRRPKEGGEREQRLELPPLPRPHGCSVIHHQRYLDEGLQIAIKQLMVIHGAGPRLPHFLWFRGQGGGPKR